MSGSRLRTRRLGAILATALFTIALMPGVATAKDTRTLWIGSPDATTNAGQLLPTPVSKPGEGAPVNATLLVVQIKSTDNQNLAHTVLTIDTNFQNVSGLSLEKPYYDPDNGDDASPSFCSDDGKVITCDYGSLRARTDRTVAVVVDVDSNFVAAPTVQPLFWARVTTNNENGTNQQVFIATSGPFADNPTPPPPFTVGDFDANQLTSFAPPGQVKHLFTSAPSGDNLLSTTIDFTAHAAGDKVSMKEGTSDSSTYLCPKKLSCQAPYSEVKVGNGIFSPTSYFSWQLTALVPTSYTLNQGFVAHFDTLTHSDWTLFFKDSASYCGTDILAKLTSSQHCILGQPTLSKAVNGFATLVVTVLMDHQGGMKY